MREIKFRAWDKTRNIYGEVLEIHRPYGENDRQFPDGHKGRLSLFNIKNEHDCGFWGIWIEKADLEQFTGLKDKNGREIWEGDIVQDSTRIGSIGVIQFARGHFGVNWDYAKNNDPEWEDGRIYGAWGTLTNLRRIDDGFLDDEIIIGNIHENPNLLSGAAK